MKKNEFLDIVSRQIHFFWDRDKIEKELSDHIEDSMLDFIEEGYVKEEAEKMAVNQMGSPVDIGQQLNREHHPVLGYLWLLSNLMILWFIVLSLPYVQHQLKGLWAMSHPVVISEAETRIDAGIKADTKAHHFEFETLYLLDEETAVLTYRFFNRFEYSRMKDSYPFEFINENGGRIPADIESCSTLIGSFGTIRFRVPKDRILRIRFKDGSMICFNLEDVQ